MRWALALVGAACSKPSLGVAVDAPHAVEGTVRSAQRPAVAIGGPQDPRAAPPPPPCDDPAWPGAVPLGQPARAEVAPGCGGHLRWRHGEARGDLDPAMPPGALHLLGGDTLVALTVDGPHAALRRWSPLALVPVRWSPRRLPGGGVVTLPEVARVHRPTPDLEIEVALPEGVHIEQLAPGARGWTLVGDIEVEGLRHEARLEVVDPTR